MGRNKNEKRGFTAIFLYSRCQIKTLKIIHFSSSKHEKKTSDLQTPHLFYYFWLWKLKKNPPSHFCYFFRARKQRNKNEKRNKSECNKNEWGQYKNLAPWRVSACWGLSIILSIIATIARKIPGIGEFPKKFLKWKSQIQKQILRDFLWFMGFCS